MRSLLASSERVLPDFTSERSADVKSTSFLFCEKVTPYTSLNSISGAVNLSLASRIMNPPCDNRGEQVKTSVTAMHQCIALPTR